MRRRVWIALGAIALLVPGAWFGAGAMLGVDRHRTAVAELLAETTGWHAKVGPLSLALAPGAVIALDGLELSDARGASRLSAGRAVLRARLAPLVGRRLEIREIEILRPVIRLGRQGGRLGLPPLAAVARAAKGGGAARLLELRVRGGRVAGPDDGGASPVALSDLSLVFVPATGRLWGSGRVEGGGHVRWLGKAGDRLEIEFDGVDAALVADRFDLAPPGIAGRVSGRAVLGSTGRLDVEALLTELAGPGGPWPDVTLALGIEPAGADGRPLEGTAGLGDVELAVSGVLGGRSRLTLVTRDAPTGAAVPLLARLVLLPLDTTGGGRLDGTLDLQVVPGEGDAAPRFVRRWEVRATAAGVRPVPGLPLTVTGASFDAAGRDGSPAEARVVGRLAGGRIDLALEGPAGAPGAPVTCRGTLVDADLDSLLAQLAPGVSAAGVFSGTLRVEGRGTCRPRAADGGHGVLQVTVDPLEAPGWDLLAPWGAALASIAGDGHVDAPAPPAPATRLTARVAVREGALILEDVTITAQDVTARGAGRYDPATRRLALALDLTIDGAARAWLDRRWEAIYRAPRAGVRRVLVVEGSPGSPAMRLDGSLPAPPPSEPDPDADASADAPGGERP